MRYSEYDIDQECERAEEIVTHVEKNIIKIYGWAFDNCGYMADGVPGDCPFWVFNRLRQIYEEITELQEMIRRWEE